ncbi:NAD-dependent epimerase/dehydratase family protein [Puia dinghuensis]|uniref:NAD-dependent epimerase n=1 Tax=Puia dinghuensis TaxID=1792502 RepID=A0A8J2XRK9_9BACT|nr:NAD-dependent epimerase/dehydratase family protein [Puia dinghuensis]GGB02423.1 NAD-dependent epimerase [Puia dinghuensis]
MKKDTILVIGAKGQIGVELTQSLRKLYGHSHVVAADLGPVSPGLEGGPYVELDVLEREELGRAITRYDISRIYLLAAKLSAVAERLPLEAWNVNMLGLLNVLEAAREKGIGRVFWPSSIAVFGPDAPKWNCPQNGPLNPATVYGISKVAGESWCRYYWEKYAVDVRSIRYPGLISYQSKPGGGTTDYAVEIFHEALHTASYSCYLRENTILPMMYMPDAIRATIELMAVPATALTVRGGYNINAMSFSPRELALVIQRYVPEFKMSYRPDFRQTIADGWIQKPDDSVAAADWKWEYAYGISETVRHMLSHLSAGVKLAPGRIRDLEPAF